MVPKGCKSSRSAVLSAKQRSLSALPSFAFLVVVNDKNFPWPARSSGFVHVIGYLRMQFGGNGLSKLSVVEKIV